MYIPTITGAEASHEQQVQMPAILSYSPAAIGAPPLVAARRTIVADAIQGAPILQYRTTTLFTQVQCAQTTFHYPPTPPIEAADLEKGQPTGESPHLPMDAESHLEKAGHPFPSLPTPPDLTSISAAEQCHPSSAPMATSPVCMDSAKQSPTTCISNPGGPWQAQNFCFMSQQTLPFGCPGANSSSIAARRQVPQPPALYYPFADRLSMNPKKVPPLLKDCGGMEHCGGEPACSY